jgi:flagellar hook assembly protein FlgD
MVGVINPEPQRVTLQQANLKIHSPGHVNANLTIDFFLPHSDLVTVKIYDLSGHEVTSLVNKYLESGPHNVTWNTRNVAAGCYVVRMHAWATAVVKSVPLFR